MLTPRERVIKALNHEEPDRVPIDLFFHAGMLTDASYFALKKHLGIEGDIEPFRKGLGANYYDERILEALRDGSVNRREAAEKLGISPRTLRHKLARLREAGVDVPAA